MNLNSNMHSQRRQMKKLVGYGFSLPSKSSLFNIGIFDLLGFLFVGRLKPYPTVFLISKLFYTNSLIICDAKMAPQKQIYLIKKLFIYFIGEPNDL